MNNTQIYDIPSNPDFNFIEDERTKLMLSSAYNTISNMEMWQFLKKYELDITKGFIFNINNEINKIQSQININYDDLHSGCSLGFTMQHMNYIAKNGFDNYKLYISYYN
jgi:hypothetical protein